MSEPASGSQLAGRYTVLGKLGAGGMGVVLEARDQRLDRLVAVKLLPAEAVGDRRARERLLREARAAAGLEHPGIVHVYDVGETDEGGAFLVLELVRGRSWRTLLEKGVPRAESLRIVREVGEALVFAHRAGFVHRDVKPDNVMVRDDGRVVVLDFGLAKRVGSGPGEPEPSAAMRPTTLTAEGAG
jgi:serine/threonine-protein kinase